MESHRVNVRSNHFGIHYYYMRECHLGGHFVIKHVSSAPNLVDTCSEALPQPTLERLVKDMGLKKNGLGYLPSLSGHLYPERGLLKERSAHSSYHDPHPCLLS
jgi:hypothetical protein